MRKFVLLLALFLLLTACGKDAASSTNPPASTLPRKHVTFMAGFAPQANLPFVGAYVAQEKGFFADEGLDVDIRHALNNEHLQLLLAGEIQFTTANGAQVLQRNDQGFPIVAIALIGQRSEQGYAVLANSSIKTVQDWAGKTFGYKGTVPAEFYAIAAANGLDPSKVNQVRVGFDPRILSEGQVDILSVFFSNEPDTLARAGFQTRIFDPNDYGIQSLGLTYVTTPDYIKKDPDAVQRFLKATLKGIDYANTHRDEALDIVMKYAPDQDREHERFMLNTELDRDQTDLTKKNGWGWQTTAQWQNMADTLYKYGAISKPADLNVVFTDQFLQAIYKDGKLVWP